MEDGVWRTVGGRRIFIKDGESLSEAMKKSGKFKNLSDKAIENNIKVHHEDEKLEQVRKEKEEKADYLKMSDQELREELEHNRNMLNEMERRLSGRYELSEEKRDELERRAAHYESAKDDIRDELRKRKGMGPVEREKDTRSQKELLEDRKKFEAKMAEKYDDKEAKEFDDKYQKRMHELAKENNDKQLKEKSELHKKLEKDMGEELVEHTNDKGDKWYSSKSLDDEEKQARKQIEKESNVKISSKFKNAPADIQKNVSDFEKAGLKVDDAFETNLYGNGKEDRFMLKDGGYIAHTKEAFGQKEDSWSLEQNYDKDGNYNPKSTKFKSYDDMIKHLSGSDDSSNSTPGSKLKSYAKAYEEYKRKHPNTKITINQFVKYSEGK